MTYPFLCNVEDLDDVWLCPRFAVEQTRADGSVKYRACDDVSSGPLLAEAPSDACGSDKKKRKLNSINGFTGPGEKLRHDTIDTLSEAMKKFVALSRRRPWLLKVDVDAAYRRIPVLPEHRWACVIAFVLLGQTYISNHLACPFGAVASVHAWERIGAAICFIARMYLKIGLLRFVDDMFAPERQGSVKYAMR